MRVILTCARDSLLLSHPMQNAVWVCRLEFPFCECIESHFIQHLPFDERYSLLSLMLVSHSILHINSLFSLRHTFAHTPTSTHTHMPINFTIQYPCLAFSIHHPLPHIPAMHFCILSIFICHRMLSNSDVCSAIESTDISQFLPMLSISIIQPIHCQFELIISYALFLRPGVVRMASVCIPFFSSVVARCCSCLLMPHALFSSILNNFSDLFMFCLGIIFELISNFVYSMRSHSSVALFAIRAISYSSVGLWNYWCNDDYVHGMRCIWFGSVLLCCVGAYTVRHFHGSNRWGFFIRLTRYGWYRRIRKEEKITSTAI